MVRKFLAIVSVLLLFASCGTDEKKELTDEEKHSVDSISKVHQRRAVDSLKKINPLLIMPPDSTYTGEYIDKYPGGIIKYSGFFRFGKRHGQWVSFYPNGTPWSEQSYNKGLKEGVNIAYHENSKIYFKGFWKADKRDSIWAFYDSTGKLIRTTMFREDKEIPLTTK
jgi:hypothetical protein